MQVLADNNNPLNLGLEYTWQEGDCLATVALKYRQPREKYLELLQLNIEFIQKIRYLLRPGDKIKVPENWFPLPPIQEQYSIKLRGTHGYRV